MVLSAEGLLSAASPSSAVVGGVASTITGEEASAESPGETGAGTGSEAGCEETLSSVLAGGTDVQVADSETKASRISNANEILRPPHPFGKGPPSFLMNGLYQIVVHL